MAQDVALTARSAGGHHHWWCPLPLTLKWETGPLLKLDEGKKAVSVLVYTFLPWPLPVRQAMVMLSPLKEIRYHLNEQTRTNMSARSATGVE